jgi:hypothetical protein
MSSRSLALGSFFPNTFFKPRNTQISKRLVVNGLTTPPTFADIRHKPSRTIHFDLRGKGIASVTLKRRLRAA